MTTTRRIFGTTDEITTCDLCGRSDLKSTVIIDYVDPEGNREGEMNYYGSDCASKIFTGRKDATVARGIMTAAKAANRVREAAEREAAIIAHQAELATKHAPFYAWIKATYGVTVTSFGDIYDNSKALGRKSPYTLKAEYEAA